MSFNGDKRPESPSRQPRRRSQSKRISSVYGHGSAFLKQQYPDAVRPTEADIDAEYYASAAARICTRGSEFSILFAGPASCGKTSLIHQTLLEPNGVFTEHMLLTIEEYITTYVNSTRVTVMDTGGSSNCRVLVEQAMETASMVVFVFDASRPETLMELMDFADSLVRIRNRDPLPPVILVANKTDLAPFRWQDHLSEEQKTSLERSIVNFYDATPLIETHCPNDHAGYSCVRTGGPLLTTSQLRDRIASCMSLASSRSNISSSTGDIGSVGSLNSPTNSGGVLSTARSPAISPRVSYNPSAAASDATSAPCSPRREMPSPRSYSTGQLEQEPSQPRAAAGSPRRAASSGVNFHAIGPMIDEDDRKCVLQ